MLLPSGTSVLVELSEFVVESNEFVESNDLDEDKKQIPRAIQTSITSSSNTLNIHMQKRDS